MGRGPTTAWVLVIIVGGILQRLTECQPHLSMKKAEGKNKRETSSRSSPSRKRKTGRKLVHSARPGARPPGSGSRVPREHRTGSLRSRHPVFKKAAPSHVPAGGPTAWPARPPPSFLPPPSYWTCSGSASRSLFEFPGGYGDTERLSTGFWLCVPSGRAVHSNPGPIRKIGLLSCHCWVFLTFWTLEPYRTRDL